MKKPLHLILEIALLGFLICLAQAAFSLKFSFDPAAWHFRVSVPVVYDPSPEIRAVQAHQHLHPRLGFLWEPNVTTDDNVVFAWGDQEPGALSTDAIGFVNPPQAIEKKGQGQQADIIGVGASFMQGAASIFHDFFDLQGRFYYNMANQRFTLPQFNLVMSEYAIPARPKWIFYEVNDASYRLIDDFASWQKSRIDWFAFHSGTWCGPALRRGWLARNLPVLDALVYSSFRKAGVVLTPHTDSKDLEEKALITILEARKIAEREGIGFVAVLIPGKEGMLRPDAASYSLTKALAPRLTGRGVVVADLRNQFQSFEDPSQLYYRSDGHWNRQGILIAARALGQIAKMKEMQ